MCGPCACCCLVRHPVFIGPAGRAPSSRIAAEGRGLSCGPTVWPYSTPRPTARSPWLHGLTAELPPCHLQGPSPTPGFQSFCNFKSHAVCPGVHEPLPDTLQRGPEAEPQARTAGKGAPDQAVDSQQHAEKPQAGDRHARKRQRPPRPHSRATGVKRGRNQLRLELAAASNLSGGVLCV